MKEDLNRLIIDSGFRFRPGFSDRVIHTLKHTVPFRNASELLTDRIIRMFYWVNIPTAAVLLVVVLLFFLSHRREKEQEYASGAELSEYVFDYYVSN